MHSNQIIQTEKITPSLKLYPEIRNLIYHYALVEDDPIDNFHLLTARDPYKWQEPGMLNLHITNGITKEGLAIRNEALAVYYGGSMFQFWICGASHMDMTRHETEDFEEWMQFLGQEKRGLLKDVRCTFHQKFIKRSSLEKPKSKVIAWMSHVGLPLDETVVKFDMLEDYSGARGKILTKSCDGRVPRVKDQVQHCRTRRSRWRVYA